MGDVTAVAAANLARLIMLIDAAMNAANTIVKAPIVTEIGMVEVSTHHRHHASHCQAHSVYYVKLQSHVCIKQIHEGRFCQYKQQGLSFPPPLPQAGPWTEMRVVDADVSEFLAPRIEQIREVLAKERVQVDIQLAKIKADFHVNLAEMKAQAAQILTDVMEELIAHWYWTSHISNQCP